MSVLPSNSIPIFILLCFTILFHIPNVTADEEIILQECSSDYYTYGSGTDYETNLSNLLDSLVTGASRDGYFNTSVGESPNIAYGLAQCRGDLSMEHCNTCLNSAKLEIIRDCTDGVIATLRYDRCMLRYSDATFFSEESTNRTATYYTTDIADYYFNNFSQSLEFLMNKLSNAVSKPNRYSFEQTNYAPFKYLYAAVQCTRDLSESACGDCLDHLYSYIPTCCNASEGAQIVTETCYMRYDIENFVEDSSQSPGMVPTPAPGSPPSSNRTLSPPSPVSRTSEGLKNKTSNGSTSKGQTSNGNDGGKSFNVLYVIVAIITSIMLK